MIGTGAAPPPGPSGEPAPAPPDLCSFAGRLSWSAASHQVIADRSVPAGDDLV